jgi:hypothetical protein
LLAKLEKCKNVYDLEINTYPFVLVDLCKHSCVVDKMFMENGWQGAHRHVFNITYPAAVVLDALMQYPFSLLLLYRQLK